MPPVVSPGDVGRGMGDDAGSASAVPPIRRPDSGEQKRITMPLRADGSVAVDRMRDDTKQQLARMLQSPELAKELGLDAPIHNGAVAMFEDLCDPLINALDTLNMLALLQITKPDPAVLREFGHYSDREKGAIKKPLAKVLAKYSGGALEKWGDEIGLCVLLVSLTSAKAAAIRAVMRGPDAPAAPAPPPPPVAPDAPDSPADIVPS